MRGTVSNYMQWSSASLCARRDELELQLSRTRRVLRLTQECIEADSLILKARPNDFVRHSLAVSRTNYQEFKQKYEQLNKEWFAVTEEISRRIAGYRRGGLQV